MTQRPLLIFPVRGEASRSKLNGRGAKVFAPSCQVQYTRLNPKFATLNNILESKRISLQQNPTGVTPEMVLVFETVGRIDDFIKAVNKIEGLEWLGEIDIDEIAPEDDFYQLNSKGERSTSAMGGRLYMVFTNTQAMSQLLSFWNIYRNNENAQFSGGKTKLRDVFKLLNDIRTWGVQDRFSDSNILSIWRENLQLFPDRVVRFEVELWYRSQLARRVENYNSVKVSIENLGGRVMTTCDIPEISYHAILAELPAIEIQNILEHEATELIQCESIMFFKPCGQVAIKENYGNDTLETLPETHQELPSGNPIVAVLDGFPLANHNILRDRLRIDDPDNLESYYQVEDRKHGTAMCSLIIHGDLNKSEPPISTPLYVRPIMRPDTSSPSRHEFIPDDFLFVDVIHRAVKEMFDGDNGNPPSATTIKVINLSIGDSDRPFWGPMSPCAKLLDWLGYKYQVLFVVSAGNCIRDINIGITENEFNTLDTIEKEKLIINAILDDRSNRRILSPAESINSITVGSVHLDYSSFYSNERRLNPYSATLPATYSPICSGYRKSIKPDMVYEGGKQMFDFSFVDRRILCPKNYSSPPGQKVAAPNSTLSNTVHLIGTSNSAAIISRLAHFCFDTLKEIFSEDDIDSVNTSILIKAMLAHGCSWDTIEPEIDSRVTFADWWENKRIKNNIFGYGIPDISKVQECTEQRATVIGFGSLSEEGAHIYNLPLPPSLSSQLVKRRLTITLAWFSPISPLNQKYRTSKLWFEANNSIARQRINSEAKTATRGTLQHEIFEGDDAAAFVDGDVIQIKVNRTADAAKFIEEIPYALIVSLEVANGIPMSIYEEIRDRISIPITVRPEL